MSQSQIATVWREPVMDAMKEFMASKGYTPVWQYQVELDDAYHTMGQNPEGIRALFYWTIDGVFSGPFPESPE